MRKLKTIVLLLMLPMLLTGCSWKNALIGLGIIGAAAGGAAAVYYIKGDLEAEDTNKPEVVHAAAIKEVESRGWMVREKTFEDGKGVVVAGTAKKQGDEDRTVTIKTTPTEASGTHLSIRVGTFGDEALSRDIYNDINARLK